MRDAAGATANGKGRGTGSGTAGTPHDPGSGGSRPRRPQSEDDSRDGSFAAHLIATLNSGALALALSIGHRTGLFDALAGGPPATSAEIARRAGLRERYVREWLGAVVTGGVVLYDPAAETYRLPPERARFLTRRSSPENLAVTAQFLPMLASVEDRLVECFRAGGGIDAAGFHRFHEVMAEQSRQTVVARLFDAILPLVPGLCERLQRGLDVLDAGCGKARALLALASAYPNSRFAGYDIAAGPVADAARAAGELGLTNLRVECLDLADLAEESAYDLVTAFDAVHDQAAPGRVLANLHRALRPGGLLLMQDIAASRELERNLDHPLGPFLYTVSYNHCLSVSLARGGDGLGACWGVDTAVRMLEDAGFTEIRVEELPHDLLNVFYIARA